MSSKKSSSKHIDKEKSSKKSRRDSNDESKEKSLKSRDKRDNYDDSQLISQRMRSSKLEPVDRTMRNDTERAFYWAHDKLEDTDDPFEDDFNDRITQPLKKK